MQLSPLQSRLAASVAASIILIILALTLLPGPKLAFAAEVNDVSNIILDDVAPEESIHLKEGDRGLDSLYDPEFSAFDRSLIGRPAEDGVAAELSDSVPAPFALKAGEVAYFMFQSGRILPPEEQEMEDGSSEGLGQDRGEASQEELRRDLGTRSVFISANTCMQLQRTSDTLTSGPPPQLELLVSTDPSGRVPNETGPTTKTIPFDEGAVIFKADSEGAVYFGVKAPALPQGMEGTWEFEVAVSTEGYYHSYVQDDDDLGFEGDMHLVDRDSSGALLMTNQLTDDASETQDFLDADPPFALFAAPAGSPSSSSPLDGVRKSFCGLRRNAAVVGMHDVEHANKLSVAMTTRGSAGTGMPQQHFWLGGLDAGTTYEAILVRISGGGPVLRKRLVGEGQGNGRGIKVLRQVDFDTGQDGTCQVITGLSLCADVNYAVPSNPSRFSNRTQLARFYDDYTRRMFSNFDKVMQQIPCEADPTQRYSLVVGCDDCRAAYTRWLCAVSVPRCEEVTTSTNPFASLRAIDSQFADGSRAFTPDQVADISGRQGPAVLRSRNEVIDTQVRPGPYREVLPCDDICFDLVRSCPASMGFSCPARGSEFFSSSYAEYKGEGVDGCSKPPSFTPKSAAAARLSTLSTTPGRLGGSLLLFGAVVALLL